MEALCSSLVVCTKTEMIDSSCKSHITGSKGLLSRNAANHTERSWHPQVRQPLNPSLNYACEMTDFPGNFSKHPNSCHTHLSWAEWAGACVCVSAPPRMCNCACRFQCVYLCVTERVSYARISQWAEASVSGDEEPTVSLPVTRVAQWAKYSALRVKP